MPYAMMPERWQRALDPLEKVHTLINDLIRAMTDNPEEPPYDELDPLDPRNRWARINRDWGWQPLLSLRKTIAALKYQGRFEYPYIGNSLGRGFSEQLVYYGAPSTVALSGGVTEEAIVALFDEHLRFTGVPREIMAHTCYLCSILGHIDLQFKTGDTCARTSFWFTPSAPIPASTKHYQARPDHARYAQPCLHTIWQRDDNQD